MVKKLAILIISIFLLIFSLFSVSAYLVDDSPDEVTTGGAGAWNSSFPMTMVYDQNISTYIISVTEDNAEAYLNFTNPNTTIYDRFVVSILQESNVSKWVNYTSTGNYMVNPYGRVRISSSNGTYSNELCFWNGTSFQSFPGSCYSTQNGVPYGAYYEVKLYWFYLDFSTVYVNCTGGNDANDGTSWATAKSTIQAGISIVDVNGTVNVAGGVCPEDIVINKSLTLQGAGRDSTTIRRSVTVDDVVQIAASNVLIDGVTVDGSAVAYDCVGVEGDGVYDNLTVTNCRLTNSTDSALYFAIGWNKGSHAYPADMGTGFVVNDNLISYFSDSSGDGGLYFMYALDIEVKRNTIGPSNDRPSKSLDYGGTGIYMMDYTYGVLENNTIDKVYGAIMVNSVVNSTLVQGNVITDSIYGILMTENFDRVVIQNNDITVRRDPQTPGYADPRGMTLGGDGDYYDSSPPFNYQVDNLMHIVKDNNITFTGSTPTDTKGVWVIPGMIDRDYGASGNVTNNIISHFGIGLRITGKSGGVDLTSHVNVLFNGNRVINCSVDADVVDWTGVNVGIDVKENWWDHVTGPDTISVKYNYCPWYTDLALTILTTAYADTYVYLNETGCSDAGYFWDCNCFDTIQEALDVTNPNATVHLANGYHSNETAQISLTAVEIAGNDTNPNNIVIQSWDTHVFNIIGDYVEIHGFNMSGGRQVGYDGGISINNVSVANLSIHHMVIEKFGWGFEVNNEVGYVISDMKIYDTEMTGNFLGGISFMCGSGCTPIGYDNKLYNNVIHHNNIKGIYVENGQFDLEIYNNTIYDNGNIPGVFLGSFPNEWKPIGIKIDSGNVSIHDNLLYNHITGQYGSNYTFNNWCGAIVLHWESGAGGIDVYDNVIYNNTNGIFVYHTTNATYIHDNNITGNVHGLLVGCDTTVGYECGIARNNSIYDNNLMQFSGNTSWGYGVGDPSDFSNMQVELYGFVPMVYDARYNYWGGYVPYRNETLWNDTAYLNFDPWWIDSGMTLASAKADIRGVVCSATTPIEASTTYFPVTFDVYALGGPLSLGYGKANLSAVSTENSCSISSLGNYLYRVYCNLSMNYYDSAGYYDLNSSVYDGYYGFVSEFNSSVCEYLQLLASTTSLTHVSFPNAAPGSDNISAETTLIINNTGNSEFDVMMTAYDLQGETLSNELLEASNFWVSLSSGGGGPVSMVDSIAVNTTLQLSLQSASSLYMFVDLPQSLFPQVYRATTPWVVSLT